MRHRTTRFARYAGGIITGFALATTSGAHAVDHVWFGSIPPASGDGLTFDDGNNWLPFGEPGTGDRAIFANGLGDFVQVLSPQTLGQMVVVEDTVMQLDIFGGGTLNITGLGGDPGLQIGGSGNVCRLELLDGTIATPHVLIAGGAASLSIEDTGRLEADLVELSTTGNGFLTLEGTTGLLGQLVLVPGDDGSPWGGVTVKDGGLLTLSDANSFEINGGVFSEIVVTTGGVMKFRGGTIGFGELRVEDVTSRIEADGTLNVESDLTITDGATFTRQPGGTANLLVGSGGIGFGNVNVTNAAFLECDGITVVDGLVTVDHGAFALVDGLMHLGADASIKLGESSGGGLGSVNVDDLDIETGAVVRMNEGTMRIFDTLAVGDAVWFWGSPTGPGVLQLADGAVGQASGGLPIGNGIGDDGRLELAGQASLVSTGTGSTADLILGDHGAGTALIEDRALVQFTDDVVLGLSADGTGQLTVSGAAGLADTQRARVRAFGSGTASEMNIGHAGLGVLFVQDGGLAESGGDTLVAVNDAGASGFVSIEGAQSGVRAELRANDDLLIGATAAGTDRGDGLVQIFDGGLVTAGDQTLVGPDDGLELYGGTLVTGTLDVRNPNIFAFLFADGGISVQGGSIFLASGSLVADGFPGTFPTWALEGADADVVNASAGVAGNGSIIMVDDARITAQNSAIGSAAGSLGFLDVHSGSDFEADSMEIGRNGDGFAAVTSGGRIDSSSTFTLGAVSGNGDLLVAGGEVTGNGSAEIGAPAPGDGGTGFITLIDGQMIFPAFGTTFSINAGGTLDMDDHSALIVEDLVLDGTVVMTIEDPTNLPFSRFISTQPGLVELGGTLEIRLGAGFAPQADIVWELILADELVGDWDQIILPPLPFGHFELEHVLIPIFGGIVDESLRLRIVNDIQGDLDLDGMVGFSDLSTLLIGWGPCPFDGPCPGDLDGSGDVGFSDLSALLALWG